MPSLWVISTIFTSCKQPRQDAWCYCSGLPLLILTVRGRREAAGYCQCSRILNKDLPLPNKCPPQSVIDHLRLSLLLPYTPPVPSRFLSSVGEMTLSRRVAYPPAPPVGPELRRFHFHVKPTVLSARSVHLQLLSLLVLFCHYMLSQRIGPTQVCP